MTKYETTFILEPGLDEARVNDEVGRVSQWIKDLGGEVIDVHRWGKRRPKAGPDLDAAVAKWRTERPALDLAPLDELVKVRPRRG